MHWIRYHIGVAYMLSPWYHIISCVHIVIKTLYNSKIALKGRIAIKIRKFNNMQFHLSWKFTRCHGVLTKTWGGGGGGGVLPNKGGVLLRSNVALDGNWLLFLSAFDVLGVFNSRSQSVQCGADCKHTTILLIYRLLLPSSWQS